MEPSHFLEEKIKEFARTSPQNRMPATDNQPIFAEPLVRFADGSDHIFTEYKTVVHPTHLRPLPRLWRKPSIKALEMSHASL